MLRPKRPLRMSAVGHNAGLMAIVTPMTADYHSTFFSGYGVRVMLISPNIQIFVLNKFRKHESTQL